MRISPGRGDRMHRIDVIPYTPSGLAAINIMNPGLTPGATFFRPYGASSSHATIGLALAHPASHKNEIQHQHDCENVSQPTDFAAATAESLDDGVADKPKREAVGN